ncbi:HD-GYP domain-containing protein [Evansella sp. AB-rgal1]|uniref:HD-GYP domain-containing protein n=1 Tax=Evansella sp. AB-rgal1 TaxID=3242696 RepID=UPI00359D8520
MEIYHEQSEFNTVLKFIKKYRYLLFIFAVFFIMLERYVNEGRNLIIIYTVVIIILGVIYQSKLVLLLQSGLITLTGYLISPLSIPFDMFFFILWFAYFMIGLAISLLISNYTIKYNSSIELTKTLANLLDSRDPYTATHSENVANYSRIIAKKMKLTKNLQEAIYVGGLLHDIGKIVIPEQVLNKPDRLTDEEFSIIKQHPQIGYSTLKHIKPFQQSGILDMVLYHHERYDGKGYPKGLNGSEIPLVARIMAVADAFDAMTSKRVYREARDIEKVITEMEEKKGSQFDPEIITIFLEYINKNKEIFLNNTQEKSIAQYAVTEQKDTV